MKKSNLLYLILCCLMFPCSNLFAAESDSLVSGPLNRGIGDCWGYDVVLAAIYPYGWQKMNYEDFEGRMFPFYLGHISFDDSGEQKMIYFTSSQKSNTRGIEAMFEEINLHRGRSYVQWFLSIDHPSICSSLLTTLRDLNVREVIRLPLGTAKNYKFSFKEQIQFTYEQRDDMLGRFVLPERVIQQGISESNLIMIPK